jgi:putative ABC transport system permease protein
MTSQFRYYAWLAWRSFRRNRILTTLMVLAIGLGIGTCMTSLTIFHLMSSDPIPFKSDRLFAVQLDNWQKDEPYGEKDGDMPDQLTYRDARYLAEAGKAKYQNMTFRAAFAVQPASDEVKPYMAVGRMTYSDFFPMFEPPFRYGAPWTRSQDAQRASVVVLSKETNDRVFGGEDSTGKQIRLGDREYTIVGVLGEYHPRPRYYDVTTGAWDDPDEFYLPLTLNDDLKLFGSGNNSCWKGPDEETYESYLQSECVWTQFWVQLDSASEREAYKSFLDSYVAEQKKLGRFPRPLLTGLRDVNEWLRLNRVVGNDVQVQLWIGLAFLLVCLLNTVGLLLAKFLGRSNETGLRRALGASRREVFAQHLIEAGSIGVAGSAVGLLLAWLGLKWVRSLTATSDALAQLDVTMVIVAVGLSIFASVLAGLYPTWRACQIAPATQLKSN